MKTTLNTLLAAGGLLFTTSLAQAHVSLAGPAFANTNFEASFTVGHGCNGADTYSVKVDIPAGVTGVRPVDSTFGKATVVKDTVTGNVTSVTWTKLVIDVLVSDDHFYRLPVRMKLPNTPFEKLYFPATQICRNTIGETTQVDWIGTGQTTALPDGEPPPEPAPAIVLLPARAPGWNKFAVPARLTDLSIFNDAEIVWAGEAAYSVNASYKALIGTEPNSTALTEIQAGTDIWVKY